MKHGLLMLLAAGLALAQGKMTLDSGKETVTISFGSGQAKVAPGGNELDINATGAPLSAKWQVLGLNVVAKSLKAQATIKSNRKYDLNSADLTGGVTFDWKQTTATTHGTCEEADVKMSDANSGKLTLSGGVAMASTDTLTGAVSTLKCPRAEVDFEERQPKNSVLTGGVTLTRTRKDASGSHLLTATADRMNILGRTRIIMSGHVHIHGNEPTLLGDMDASKATVFLDDKGSPTEIDMDGEPGTGKFTQGGGG